MGPRMKCGWGCGAQFTGRNMRAHFTLRPKRPGVSDDVDNRRRYWKAKPGNYRANAVRLALRRPTHGEPDGGHFTVCAKRPAASDLTTWTAEGGSRSQARMPPGGECYAAGDAECDSRRAGCAHTSEY